MLTTIILINIFTFWLGYKFGFKAKKIKDNQKKY